ncbi:MAG: OsmC family peroxiredoxin [Burkholderiales bacterium]|nr:MAG: OsmC family peroxiredoxin [Burkholderiales bacterium]
MTATAPLATSTSSCRLSNEPGRGLLTVRGQHVVTDSPPTLGGPNEAPNPVELLLCALSGCAAFICERAAKELGIPLGSVVVTAAGDFDPRGVCGEPFDPRFQAIRVRMTLDGPDPAQRVALLEAFKARCPVYTTLCRAAPIEIELS